MLMTQDIAVEETGIIQVRSMLDVFKSLTESGFGMKVRYGKSGPRCMAKVVRTEDLDPTTGSSDIQCPSHHDVKCNQKQK